MSTYPTLPSNLIPADGRFGCGPSKVRPAQLEAIARLRCDLPPHQLSVQTTPALAAVDCEAGQLSTI